LESSISIENLGNLHATLSSLGGEGFLQRIPEMIIPKIYK
jgi:hypothetical protein